MRFTTSPDCSAAQHLTETPYAFSNFLFRQRAVAKQEFRTPRPSTVIKLGRVDADAALSCARQNLRHISQPSAAKRDYDMKASIGTEHFGTRWQHFGERLEERATPRGMTPARAAHMNVQMSFTDESGQHEGRGYGLALLRHALLPCDREKKLAYLESTNPRNLSLYIRHGFELIGTIQVADSPPLFPMLRKPRT
jgi:hypothetical protein